MSLFRQSSRQHHDKAANVQRSASKLNMNRAKISAPVKLLSTTNMLSYTAPPVPGKRNTSNSLSSASDIETSPILGRGLPPPSPPTSPEPSLDEQIRLPKKQLLKAKSASQLSPKIEEEAPPLPDRKELRSMHSMKRLVTPPPSADNSRMPSLDLTSPAVHPLPLDTSPSRWSVKKKTSAELRPISNSTTSSWVPRKKPSQDELAVHPFGAELAQVDEIAEDFGITAEVREEEEIMRRRGLLRWKPEDYTREIESIFSSFFGYTAKTAIATSTQEHRQQSNSPTMPMWI